MRRIDLIVIHCSATRCNRAFTLEDLEACHRAKGYNGIGYHYYITRDGRIHPCRSEDAIGAHARKYNKHSIGVCYEGGLNEKGQSDDTRTPAQKRSLLTVLYSLKADYPNALILGHRDLPNVHKDCPGFDARTEYKDI